MPSLYPNDYKTIIDALVRIRKEKRITQVQLANAMRVPQSFISKAERGERRLDVAEFLHICQLLGVNPSTLLVNLPARFKAFSEAN